jgi:hypothetical protein
LLDAAGQEAAIEFELSLAGTTQADGTATLALHMRPAADQPRGHVPALGQFDLQLAFVRTRALGEDIEDQTGAVDDTALGVLLEVALLHGTQRMVDENQVVA